MMETITIRRKGYPIRHTFAEFVDRYRILVSGVGPSHNEDCRAASNKISLAVLGEADFQLGKTKVFLKVVIFLFYFTTFCLSDRKYPENMVHCEYVQEHRDLKYVWKRV